MTVTFEQKSQLAKLMATENVRVEHRNTRTAYFDTKDRVLILPIWKDMSGVMYDLLCGHEVGHALYTPPQGWHDAVSDSSKPKQFKNFLNVVEDARIEKKIKRKYPGLKMPFVKAYNELLEKDFFGIKNCNLNDLSFIDKVNIYTKSQYTNDSIEFTDFEKTLVSKVENVETWYDVVSVAEEIFEYSKVEQKEKQEQNNNQNPEPYDQFDNEFDDIDSTDNLDNQFEDNFEDPEDADQSVDSHSYENDEELTPECKTDETFRVNEDSLLDESSKPYIYLNLPKANYQNIITPAKRVHELLTNFYFTEKNTTESDANQFVSEFKNKNERYVGLLAKEFEMRKAAKTFSKSKISDTGDIDVNKLSSYKFDDNIFRKVMNVPKGKKHGLILLLDRSGSMTNNMEGSIEQILVLSMFCRKVNIPFVVYGFGDSVAVSGIDKGINYKEHYNDPNLFCFSKKEYDIALGNVFLREYLNSKMSNAEFSKSLRNLILLKNSYSDNGLYRYNRPSSESSSNTPLTQAIFAVGGIMKEFKKQYNLDLTNLIIVHDGDSDHNRGFYKKNELTSVIYHESIQYYSNNVVFRDSENKFEKLVSKNQNCSNGDYFLPVALEWFTKTTGSKIFGFFIVSNTPSSIRSALTERYVFEDSESLDQKRIKNHYNLNVVRDELVKKMRSEKYISSNNFGYKEFYFILGGESLKTEKDFLDISGDVTSSKLTKAFMKMNKQKNYSRVLVSKFVQGIAA